MSSDLDLARLDLSPFGMSHAGWAYDAYPDLPTLDAGAVMTVCDLNGPAVITNLHMTRHLDDRLARRRYDEPAAELRARGARGVVLEITFDGAARPSVVVPVADFFADGCNAAADPYSTRFVEKTPGSYNARFPMPFRERAVVRLRNDTGRDLLNYTSVEYRRLDEWPADLGYFHATWRREAFQLDPDTARSMVALAGPGRLVGQSWSIATDDPFFSGFAFVMEGNNRWEVDGAPVADYLGTEDSFGLSWGFAARFIGTHAGVTSVSHREPALLSVYRFRDGDAVPFAERLEVGIDWSAEFRSEVFRERIVPLVPWRTEWLPPPAAEGRGWIDYATTWYWYAAEPGHDHAALPALEDRVAPVLHPNPHPPGAGSGTETSGRGNGRR